MNKIHQQRLTYISLFACGLAIAIGLILYALKQNINVFVTPKQITHSLMTANYSFKLGGMVKKNSLIRDKQGLKVQFVVTDFKAEIPVSYIGVLPDLFREGKGVIAEGHLNNEGIFIATQVLAKHDENYMPKTIYQEIRKNNREI